MIDENADIVTFVDVDAHALSIYHPRQAAGNYTLREIKMKNDRMNTPRGKPRGIFDKFVFDTRRKRRGIRP